jgi:hypothetical protein
MTGRNADGAGLKTGGYVTNATTRAASHAGDRPGGRLVGQDETVRSPETGLVYRIGRLLGQGGFGQAFLATRLGRSTTVLFRPRSA